MTAELTRLLALFMSAATLAAAGQSSQPGLTPAPPQVSVISLPPFPGAHAIWGATGQDGRGRIWFGVSSAGANPKSAHLIEYDPESDRAVDRGDVVSELKRAGIWRSGEEQAKIHSRIVQAPDGLLYFASMDEAGENPDGSKLPIWGSHLWRLDPATHRWTHLFHAAEALIAVGTGDRFVYALGYFGHVLYQYDTRSGRVARVEVGSVDGHISRNFLVDGRGHAYVPRLRTEPAPDGKPGTVRVTLVEFDSTLRELHATALEPGHYLGAANPTASHGVVGLQTMADGSLFFTTHPGRLVRITPPATRTSSEAAPAAAVVTDAGWLHPQGPSYAASLFGGDGVGTLASLARRAGHPYEWVSCTMEPRRCEVARVVVPGRDDAALGRTLLYGSSTRDRRSGHYVAGIGNDYRPVVLRVQGRTQ